MKQTKHIMGMHVTVEIRDGGEQTGINKVFDYFNKIDEQFSTYKPASEISKINRGELTPKEFSPDMQKIFKLAEQTKQDTRGYFDIQQPEGHVDPSGIVKGWAIWQAAKLLERDGYRHFFIDAGGDIQARVADDKQTWSVGIKNPFNQSEIVKVLAITNQGVATSGNYERGQHIYNPHQHQKKLEDVASITVIGPNVYEADRFATASFAMGQAGIHFIESIKGLEGYMIDKDGIGTETSGLSKYLKEIGRN